MGQQQQTKWCMNGGEGKWRNVKNGNSCMDGYEWSNKLRVTTRLEQSLPYSMPRLQQCLTIPSLSAPSDDVLCSHYIRHTNAHNNFKEASDCLINKPVPRIDGSR